jgi:hypothetical protein
MNGLKGFNGKDNSVLRAALEYSQSLNWAVFPVHSVVNDKCTCNKLFCSSPGKHPRTYNGLKAATTNNIVIENWFTKYPNSNIGIATGEISGIFVLDIDKKYNGYETLEYLMDKYGKLPNTVEVSTGGNGTHFFFKYQTGIRNKTNLVPGIDVRGDGGYIVAPPSRHLSGKRYEWKLRSKLNAYSILRAPRWLIDMIIPTKAYSTPYRASDYWVSVMKGVKQGERNNKAASLVGYLLRKDIDPYMVVEIMKLWNETRVIPPLKDKELDSIIESIAGLERKRRRGERWVQI